MNCLTSCRYPTLRGVSLAFALITSLSFLQPATALAAAIEAGLIDVEATTSNGGQFTSVSFSQAFDEAPLIFVLPTVEGPDSATLRVRNVTTTGFEVSSIEAPGRNASDSGPNDGVHAAMTNVTYFAVTRGAGTLGGLNYEAGIHSTDSAVSDDASNFDTVNFGTSFSDVPALLVELQTDNNPLETPLDGNSSSPWITVSVNSGAGPSLTGITPTGFEVALERAETGDGDLGIAEDIGYFAIDRGTTSFLDDSNNLIDLVSLISANSIEGWTNNGGEDIGTDLPMGDNVPFGTTFASEPLVVASLATRDGGDGGWLRRSDVTPSGIFLSVDEDKLDDDERTHTDEAASVVAISQAFHLTLNVVPEPSTLALVGLAIVGLVSTRRRRS